MSEENAAADEPDVRRLVGAARALVAELAEEGVHAFERLPDPAPHLAAVAPRSSAASAQPPAGPALPSPAAPTPPSSAAPVPASPAPAAPKGPARPDRAPVQSPPGVAEAVPWHGTRPTLEQVQNHLGECERCGLCAGRQTIVFGEGDPSAQLLFVGEGPGEQEDRTGRPFVGRAGELLTQMIEKGIGIPRDSVYICNIVKCRPPRNRNPLPPEVAACRPFLDGQIQAIAPKVIVTLGKPAASLLLGRDVAITRERGQWQDYGGIPLMPTLHPAYVLRQYTEENRRAVWQDLKAAAERSGS